MKSLSILMRVRVFSHHMQAATPTIQDSPLFSPGHTLARSRLSLLDSRRVLDETEGIGRRVVGDLESQRESLLRSQAHVRETEGAAVKARRMLRSLSRKEFRHRLFLHLVILILSGAIVFVLYLKIRHRLE